MSDKPHLVIVTGLPASGKTTLAEKISRNLVLPLLKKDSLKELLFDTLGAKDREWSKKIGLAAYLLMDSVTEDQMKVGNNLVLEGNFKPKEHNKKFQKLQKDYQVKILQILCDADGKTLLERFKNRSRHSGHATKESLPEFEKLFATEKATSLDLEGKVLYIDTNDFKNINYKKLFDQIKDFLNQ